MGDEVFFLGMGSLWSLGAWLTHASPTEIRCALEMALLISLVMFIASRL